MSGTDGKIIRAGTPLPDDVLQLAGAAGLVRVNGLPTWQFGDYDRQPKIIPDPTIREFGKYDENNGTFACVTFAGDIFIGLPKNKLGRATADARSRFLGNEELFDPFGKGFVWVPCSNGDVLHERHVFERLAYPYQVPCKGITKYF